MTMKLIGATLACCVISACVMFPLSTDSGAAAEIGAHPIYTAMGAFYVRSATMVGLQAAPVLYFDDRHVQPTCVPPNLAAYQKAPETWKPENQESFECRHATLVPLPVGTAIQVDSVVKDWDFENGTQYLVSAHLLDPALPQRSFEIEGYIMGHRSGALHLDPAYFTAAPAKASQP